MKKNNKPEKVLQDPQHIIIFGGTPPNRVFYA